MTKAIGKRAGAKNADAPEKTKSQLVIWAKDPARTADELASACGQFPEVDRAVAAHPNAGSSLLSELSHSSDKATRARVAANPATATADLLRLGGQFPKAFLDNPALDLLMLENPALLESIPQALLVRLLKSDRCPADFLVWAAAHADEKLQLAVAMNVNVPPPAVDRLRQSIHARVREAVQALAALTNKPEDDPEVMFRSAVQERLGALTPAEAKDAWEHGDVGLPQWPYLPLLFRWEESELVKPYFLERTWLANPKVPASILKVLSKSLNHQVRKLVNIHPNMPQPLREAGYATPSHDTMAQRLETAAQLESEQVPESTANTASPKSIQDLIVSDEAERIRVAGLINMPEYFLDTLSRDKSVNVRAAVGANPNAPPSTLECLSVDEDMYVRTIVAANERASSKLIDSMVHEMQAEWVLAAVEARDGLDASLQARLRQLARRSDWYKSEISRERPAVQKAAEHDDILHSCAPDPSKAVLSSRTVATLMALCAGPFIEPSRIARISVSSDWLVRAAVARNPGTPDNLLERLRGDSDSRVRALASRQKPSKDAGENSTNAPCIQLDLIAREIAKEFEADVRADVLGDPVWRHFSSIYDLWCYLANPALADIRPFIGEPLWFLLWEAGENIEYLFMQQIFFHLGKFISGHEDCPAKTLEKISRSNDPEVLVALVRNPSAADHLRRSTMERLAEILQSDPPAPNRWKIYKNPDTPPDLFQHLANEKDEGILERVARNPSAPMGVLKDLSRWASCARSVAENPNVSGELVDFLQARWGSFILEGFAANPNPQVMLLAFEKMSKSNKILRQSFDKESGTQSLASILEKLALSGKSSLRRTLAKNPCTPAATLQILANDKDEATREGVASNPSAPALILEYLAADKSGSVRGKVAKNTQTPRSILERLASDEDGLVRCYVAVNPSRPLPPAAKLAEIARDFLEGLQRNQKGTTAASPPLTQQDLLRALIWLRRVPESANNKALTKLAHSQDWLSRLGVALHPQASAGQLKLLAKDENPHVAAIAVNRTPESP